MSKYTYYDKNGEHICRHRQHLEFCEKQGKFVRYHHMRKMKSIEPFLYFSDNEIKILMNPANLHIPQNIITPIGDFIILSLEIQQIIIGSLVRKIPKTLCLLSKSITTIFNKILEDLKINKKLLVKMNEGIVWEKNSYTSSLEMMKLPKLQIELTPNNFEEIEERLFIIAGQHLDLLIDARRFYNCLLTEEFADYILDKYGIDNENICELLPKLSNYQFAIFIMLPHVRNAKIIFEYFPTDTKHMITLREKFGECYL